MIAFTSMNMRLHGIYVQCSTNTWQSITPIGHIQALAANALRRPTSKTGLSLLSLVNTCRKEHNLAFLNSCLDNGVQYKWLTMGEEQVSIQLNEAVSIRLKEQHDF